MTDKEVAMSDTQALTEIGAQAVDDLFHYGVPGMKWGVRKTEADGSPRQRGKVRSGLTKVGDAGKAATTVSSTTKNQLKAAFLPAESRQAVLGELQTHMLGAAIGMRKDPRFAGKDIKYDAKLRETYRKEMESIAETFYSERIAAEYTALGVDAAFRGAKAAYDYKQKRAEIRDGGDRVRHEDAGAFAYLDFEYDDKGFITEVEVTEGELKHYGVPGMKWGVRKSDRASGSTAKEVVVTQKKPGTFAKAKGGQRHAITEDAASSLAVRRKAKVSTTDALSNQELQAAVNRMNLEVQYRRLEQESDRRSKGKKFIDGIFGDSRYGGKEKYKAKDPYEQLGKQFGEVMSERANARAKS